jgi:hypothetical protein
MNIDIHSVAKLQRTKENDLATRKNDLLRIFRKEQSYNWKEVTFAENAYKIIKDVFKASRCIFSSFAFI